MHRASFASLIAAALIATGCGGKVVVDAPTTAAGGTAGGGGAGGSPAGNGGWPNGCTADSDCGPATACQIGSCILHECVAKALPDGAPCDDGLFCTKGDVCQAGACVGGPQIACPSSGPCTVGVCSEQVKGCQQVPAADGQPCDATDTCTVGNVCQGGVCAGGKPEDCSALNGPCAVGKCVPGQGCTAVPFGDGTPCEDGLFCTQGDLCKGGVCAGGPSSPCGPADACHVSSCDEAANACVLANVADGTPCDDGNPCSVGDHCQAGVCTGAVGSGVVYFADDFHDNSKGWTLGPEWQIGSAKASMGGAFGHDPGQDHTPTADNGIAGVVLGGTASTMTHPFSYLTSPPFDTSQATGPVVLSFYRWLDADYDPFMHSSIDVWNGTQWVNVFMTGMSPVQDDAWTFESYDLTAYKNPAMQIRFGFDVTNPQVFKVPSWNVDDVTVSDKSCP